MDFSINKIKCKKLVATFIALSFIIVAFLGVHFTMKMDTQGKMQKCPILGQFEKDCPMKVTEHIWKWQQLLTATFQPNILSKLLLIVLSFAFSFIGLKYLRFSQIISSSPFLSFQKTAPPFQEDYLLAVLSQGVLRKRE